MLRRLALRLVPLVCLLPCLVASARAAEIAFARVWPQWHDAEAFDRISEYFTGKENTGTRLVLRTHAEERAGFYFLVRVDNSGAILAGAKFVLHVIAPGSTEEKTYTFPADVPAGGAAFHLGLTGADWPNKRLRPVAWKLELVGPAGSVPVQQKSFLWEKPAK